MLCIRIHIDRQPAIPTDFTPTEERHPMAAFVRSVDERRVLWGDVPAELDVLLTHAPPRGVLDALLSDDSHVGCLLLAERLAELHRASAGGSGGAPRWHIFGHIHEARGVEIGARLGGEDLASTTFVNAASVNMMYVDQIMLFSFLEFQDCRLITRTRPCSRKEVLHKCLPTLLLICFYLFGLVSS